MKVLVFGSLNIDYNYHVDHFVRKGETLSSQQLSVYCGGKGLNQSIALARAGAEVFQAGCIGSDGQFLLPVLAEAKVNRDYLKISDDVKTGHAIIQIDREGDNCILLFGGANQEITTDYVDMVLDHFSAGDFLVLQNEINEMAYIMERAGEKGMVVVFNPSPMDDNVKTYPLDHVNYLILNEVEALQMVDEPIAAIDSDQILDRLHRRFPKSQIILTMGSSGSAYTDGERKICQNCYPVKAVDTTAAGDTYTGYLIAALMRGEAADAAMDLAAKASALAVTRPGASQSIPALAEVLAF